jgi:hypothetical protein
VGGIWYVTRYINSVAAMPEANIQHAISRGLLNPEDRAKPWSVIQACYAFWLAEPAMHALAPLDRARPWTVIQACYASWLSESAMQWLIENGLITDDQRLCSLSDWLDPHEEMAFGT